MLRVTTRAAACVLWGVVMLAVPCPGGGVPLATLSASRPHPPAILPDRAGRALAARQGLPDDASRNGRPGSTRRVPGRPCSMRPAAGGESPAARPAGIR